MSDKNNRVWYYLDEGQREVGPLSLSELATAYAENLLCARSYIRKGGAGSRWHVCVSVEPFYRLVAHLSRPPKVASPEKPPPKDNPSLNKGRPKGRRKHEQQHHRSSRLGRSSSVPENLSSLLPSNHATTVTTTTSTTLTTTTSSQHPQQSSYPTSSNLPLPPIPTPSVAPTSVYSQPTTVVPSTSHIPPPTSTSNSAPSQQRQQQYPVVDPPVNSRRTSLPATIYSMVSPVVASNSQQFPTTTTPTTASIPTSAYYTPPSIPSSVTSSLPVGGSKHSGVSSNNHHSSHNHTEEEDPSSPDTRLRSLLLAMPDEEKRKFISLLSGATGPPISATEIQRVVEKPVIEKVNPRRTSMPALPQQTYQRRHSPISSPLVSPLPSPLPHHQDRSDYPHHSGPTKPCAISGCQFPTKGHYCAKHNRVVTEAFDLDPEAEALEQDYILPKEVRLKGQNQSSSNGSPRNRSRSHQRVESPNARARSKMVVEKIQSQSPQRPGGSGHRRSSQYVYRPKETKSPGDNRRPFNDLSSSPVNRSHSKSRGSKPSPSNSHHRREREEREKRSSQNTSHTSRRDILSPRRYDTSPLKYEPVNRSRSKSKKDDHQHPDKSHHRERQHSQHSRQELLPVTSSVSQRRPPDGSSSELPSICSPTRQQDTCVSMLPSPSVTVLKPEASGGSTSNSSDGSTGVVGASPSVSFVPIDTTMCSEDLFNLTKNDLGNISAITAAPDEFNFSIDNLDSDQTFISERENFPPPQQMRSYQPQQHQRTSLASQRQQLLQMQQEQLLKQKRVPQHQPTLSPKHYDDNPETVCSASVGQTVLVTECYLPQFDEVSALSLSRGTPVTVLNNSDPSWWLIRTSDGQEGYYPNSYLASPPQSQPPSLSSTQPTKHVLPRAPQAPISKSNPSNNHSNPSNLLSPTKDNNSLDSAAQKLALLSSLATRNVGTTASKRSSGINNIEPVSVALPTSRKNLSSIALAQLASNIVKQRMKSGVTKDEKVTKKLRPVPSSEELAKFKSAQLIAGPEGKLIEAKENIPFQVIARANFKGAEERTGMGYRELSFKTGENLWILSASPDSNGWWLAKKERTGLIGLIPCDYIGIPYT